MKVGGYVIRIVELPGSPFKEGAVAPVTGIKQTGTKQGDRVDWVYIRLANPYGIEWGCIRDTVRDATEEEVVRFLLAGGRIDRGL